MGVINKNLSQKWASSRRNVPWLTPAIRRLCKKKQRLCNCNEGLYSSCSGTTAKFRSSVGAAAGDQISVKTSVGPFPA